MHAGCRPLVGTDRADERAQCRDVSARLAPEQRHRLMPIALDCTDALGVALGPPEWHDGIGTLRLEHRARLGDPVRDELGKMRPDLAPFPLLAGLGISIGE